MATFERQQDTFKLELTKVIRELPEDTEFALMFYETSVRLWRKELVIASEDNKLEAIAFIRRLGYGDRTNTYGALRESLAFDNDLESVFMLTDSEFSVARSLYVLTLCVVFGLRCSIILMRLFS